MYILQYSFEIPYLIFKDTALFLFCTLFHIKIVTCKLKKFTFLSMYSTKCLRANPTVLTVLYQQIHEVPFIYHIWSSYFKGMAAFCRDLVEYDMP
jgi:hypothetical protein